MTAHNMQELDAMLMRELKKAMNVTSNKALGEMYGETGGFYTGGEPKMYERTGALGDTPRTTSIRTGGKTVSFEAYLDQKHQYTTGDEPTMDKVLNLANSGIPWTTKSGSSARRTVGKRGFWERAEKKIGKSFEKTLGSFFK